MVKHALMALALVSVAGAAQAQTVIVDPYGPPQTVRGPMISSPPQPSPGDYSYDGSRSYRMDQQAQAMPEQDTVRRSQAFRDEYGFRYDARGNRIDASGRLISPHSTTP